MINPKRKGSAFERDICTRLSLWITKGARKDVFWRSAMSGGRATVGLARGRKIDVSGDICSVHEEGHQLTDCFHIECKHLKTLDLEAFVTKNKGTLVNAWNTCMLQAKQHDKLPMLIARQNLYPILVLTPTAYSFVPHIVNYEVKCSVGLFDMFIKYPYDMPRLKRCKLTKEIEFD